MSTTFEALMGYYEPSSDDPPLDDDRDSLNDNSDGTSSVSGDEVGGNLIAVESICKFKNGKSPKTPRRRRLTKRKKRKNPVVPAMEVEQASSVTRENTPVSGAAFLLTTVAAVGVALATSTITTTHQDSDRLAYRYLAGEGERVVDSLHKDVADAIRENGRVRRASERLQNYGDYVEGDFKVASKHFNTQSPTARQLRDWIFTTYVGLGADDPDYWFGGGGTIDEIMKIVKQTRLEINRKLINQTFKKIWKAWEDGYEWSSEMNTANMGRSFRIDVNSREAVCIADLLDYKNLSFKN